MHVVPDLHTGGAERHVATLFPNLDPARFAPSVVCVGDEGELFSAVTAASIPAIALHRTKRQSVRALMDLVGEMRRRRPDVVLVRGYNAEVLGRVAAVLARVPHRVVWVHHCGDIGDPSTTRRATDRLLDRVTDAYFTVARAQQSYLSATIGCAESKVRVIHNGVDPAAFSPGDDRAALAEWGIAADAPVLGILAALRPEKDHLTLLRAVRELVDRMPGLRLLVIGDGAMRQVIERTVDELGLSLNVILTGNRADVAALLRAVDVFTLTSVTECLPMALLEAMAAGRPAVCTRVGGVPELVQDGMTGYLVPAQDPHALAEALTRLLDDSALRRQMGAAARARVEQEFTLAASVETASRAIEEVALRSGTASLQVAVPGAGRAPIRFTVVLDEASVGGVEVLLLNLFKHFDPALVRPSLVCLRSAGAIAEDIRGAGFEVTVLNRSGKFDTSTLPALVRYLRRNRTDVILVPHHHRASLALGRLAGKLARVRATVVAAHDMDLTSVGGRVLPTWAVRTLGMSDALVLLTERQGTYLHAEEGVGRYPWENIREVVIPNGIPLAPAPTSEDRERARALLGVAPDDFVVGVVGRLTAQKAHQVLFAAAVQCLPDVPTLRLVLIGDGDRAEELRQLAERLGIADRTTFLGRRRDVPDLLPGLDVSCLSSLHEGAPLALIESLAAGVPIVATDCGSVRDLVEDGEQGFVVPVLDAGALADRLRWLAKDGALRARLGAGGRARAEREFDISVAARGYEQLLAELVDHSR
jgi:glycosyltransferase involved in cell wall biosynthesis